jgi:hypothetical protein
MSSPEEEAASLGPRVERGAGRNDGRSAVRHILRRWYVVSIVTVFAAAIASLGVSQDAAPPPADKPDKTETPKASDEVIAAMAPFKPIAQATLDLVKKGDMAAAKTKITELETAWDKAEKDLRAKYPAEWKLIDVAIDKALAEVRKPKTPDAEKCTAKLQDVIAKIENPVPPATKKKEAAEK